MNSNNNQTLDGLTGYNSDPIVVPEVFNCDTTQEQGQEHDDSRKIAAVDPADCTTGHELSQANLHHPIPQYDISHFPPLGQLFYVYLPGGYVGSYMVSTDGWFQTGLHGRK